MVRVLAVAGAALALAVPAAAAKVVGVGELQNGKSVSLRHGDTLAVALPANPSTGYHWRIAAVSRRVLAPVGEAFAGPRSSGLVGAPGVAVLTFRAAAAGRTVLRLTYAAPGRGAAGRRFSLTVVVRV